MGYLFILEKLSKIAGTDKLETFVNGSADFHEITFCNEDVSVELMYSATDDEFDVNFNGFHKTYKLGEAEYALCKQICSKLVDEEQHSAMLSEKLFKGVEE